MKADQEPHPRPPSVPSERTHSEAPMEFRARGLSLLMKEREEVISRLVELDYSIWVVEEFFRAKGC